MARLGVSNLLSWRNARVGNPSKLNLIKSSYRYNQNKWASKTKYIKRTSSYYNVLTYTYVGNGTLTRRWDNEITPTESYVTCRFDEGTYRIGPGWVDHTYLYGKRISLIKQDNQAIICYPGFLERWRWSASEVTTNGVFDISLIRLFMYKYEWAFKQL